MRLRFPELLDEHGVTPYQLATRSEGRLSMSAVYRYDRERGQVKCFDAAALDALCDVLGVSVEQLLTRDPPPKRRRKAR